MTKNSITGDEIKSRVPNKAYRESPFWETRLCDCKDKSQCWEPCGELGNDEKYIMSAPDSEVPHFLKPQAS